MKYFLKKYIFFEIYLKGIGLFQQQIFLFKRYFIMQPRKFVTAERSSQKEYLRASYDKAGYMKHSETNFQSQINKYPSASNLLKVRGDDLMRNSGLQKSPSEVGFRTREDVVRNSMARRKNDGMVSNLKSQLQNLKMEVNKLMNKQSDTRSYSSKKSSVKSDDDDFIDNNNLVLGNYGKDISDSVSVTSQKIIDEPLRKLENQYGSSNYDHAHYLKLENQLLKTELRNLKNKYNATKQELKERCEALQNKNDYLEVSLHKSEESLHELKKNLQVEIQTIKFQLTRKMQHQIQEDEKKTRNREKPERDTTNDGNELLQEKLNQLYEELSEKSRMISSLNLQMNEVKGILEKKSFELKKEHEKNSELSKQFEFSKRENMRNSRLIEQEVSKKNQLGKVVDSLKEKVNSLTQEIKYKDEVNVGSEELQIRLENELKQYKQNEKRLEEENTELQINLRKQKQLSESHEMEIKHLKRSVSQLTAQIENVSKTLRIEREKAHENEEKYRKLLDETKENYENKIDLLQQEFQRMRENAQQTHSEKEEAKSSAKVDLKDKERQIKKWKAEYKLLKIKYEQKFGQESMKKQEIEGYYRNYKQYKSKNKLLEMRNRILEQSSNQSIQKIQEIEAQNLQQKAKYLKTIDQLTTSRQQQNRIIEQLERQVKEIAMKLHEECEKSKREEKSRVQIEQKVLNMGIENEKNDENDEKNENNEEWIEMIGEIKKRIGEQDDKINKYIKEGKKKDELVSKLRKEIRLNLEAQEKQFENYKNKEIAELVQKIQSHKSESLREQRTLMEKQLKNMSEAHEQILKENSSFKIQIQDLERELVDLKQEVKSITHLYNVKASELEEMREKIVIDLEREGAKREEVEKMKNLVIGKLEGEMRMKNEEIMEQRGEIKNILSVRMSFNDQPFDEALKNQIESSKKLREELNRKNEEVYRLRDAHSQLKTELDNLKSESDIQKIRHISERKNLEVSHSMQTQQLKNQLSLESKKVASLENKIKMVIDENKKKDSFIQTYIMGKKLPQNQREFMGEFMRNYEITITGKNINESLQAESQELEKLSLYNFNLMKEIAEMKDKLLLYEAISEFDELRDSMEFDSPKIRLIKSRSLSRDIDV